MIIAGEASGDLHGAALMHEYKKLDNSVEFYGIGGDKMIAAGLNSIYHINQMAFLGFTEVIKHLPFIKKVRKSLKQLIIDNKINTVILIDYPGFNLNFAAQIKELNVKIIYYISPQLWAWGEKRITKIKKLIDKVIVLFPFEEEFYKQHNVNVAYSGHPLIERIEEYNFIPKSKFFEDHNLDPAKKILLVMPGSRLQEIDKIFPQTIKAAYKIKEKFNMQIVVACSSNINENLFSKFNNDNEFKLIKGYTYELLKYSYFGIIKSGTSTLEAALFELPFIVVYSTSLITYYIGRMLIKIKNIALVNIVAQENIVYELIQHDVNQENIFNKCSYYLNNYTNYLEIKKNLSKLKHKLGNSGASANAAKIVFDTINEIKKA